jgi:hypothetical protein
MQYLHMTNCTLPKEAGQRYSCCDYGTAYTIEEWRFDSQQKLATCLFSEAFKPALGLIHILFNS